MRVVDNDFLGLRTFWVYDILEEALYQRLQGGKKIVVDSFMQDDDDFEHQLGHWLFKGGMGYRYSVAHEDLLTGWRCDGALFAFRRNFLGKDYLRHSVECVFTFAVQAF